MRLQLVAVGTRLPAWINEGVDSFARRMPRECPLSLTEIPAGRRTKSSSTSRAIAAEGSRLLKALPDDALVVALHEKGTQWSTRELARELGRWRLEHGRVALVVGGPDGLAAECLKRADRHWSLSNLTLPHGLVRIVVAEQLYRAWTILQGHPYHRA
ncbi:MAG: 23S rRNA (pseudouridine(1915)-N(3))-methyltransferase RlmH [Gammaproteobacteria bacterium]|nr:23S rRNA (pseudouridine(1915)-N(3))-methyltransferase RlmH [Gammaproteobacteria bacterium]